jgi:hypothetical protein
MLGDALIRSSSPAVNAAPADYRLDDDPGFADFYRQLHRTFAARQQLAARQARLHAGPGARRRSASAPPAVGGNRDGVVRRHSRVVRGPAQPDVVSRRRRGAGGEEPQFQGAGRAARPRGLAGERAAVRERRHRNGELPGAAPNSTAIFVRVRGLHIGQRGVVPGETTPASLFDLARIWYRIDPARLRHPFAVSIPKSESAEEALWWRDVFRALAAFKDLPHDYIKCMAIDESHPLAYQLEEFAYNLRDHIVGLTLGRLDYMASLIHFTMNDPAWVLPDRNAIPHDVLPARLRGGLRRVLGRAPAP